MSDTDIQELEVKRAAAEATKAALEAELAGQLEELAHQRRQADSYQKLALQLAQNREKELELDLRLIGIGEDIVSIVKSFVISRTQKA